MSLEIRQAPSPNFDDRGGKPVDILMMHYTGMESAEASMTRLRDPDARVSCHYLVEEDGAIFQLVAEDKRAWHAGRGCWQGEEDINARSIGIEIQNGGHDFGLPDFPEAQIDAVMALSWEIMGRHPISRANIIGHSDHAPDRKQDPGEKFPWARLAENGIGLWPGGQGASGAGLKRGDEGERVQLYQYDLAAYGYCAPRNGVFGEETELATLAFQRHFHPETLTGEADAETRARLSALLRLTLTS